MQASVKVMRSFDYCHFEMALSAEVASIDEANGLRKQAAVLVDEAVRQYKIAKAKESKREWAERQTREALVEMDAIKAKPRNEWTVRESAVMRSYEDQSFWKNYDDEAYYYEQDERDHHFSMLNRFKNVTILATTITGRKPGDTYSDKIMELSPDALEMMEPPPLADRPPVDF